MTSHDFIERGGLPFFAHRLKRLSELLVEQSGRWLKELGLATPPRGVSTLLLLGERQPLTVTEIARELRLSHPLIIELARRLSAGGLIETEQDAADGRRRLVRLTAAGVEEVALLRRANEALSEAYRSLFLDAGGDGLSCIERLEAACRHRPLLERLRDKPSPRKESK